MEELTAGREGILGKAGGGGEKKARGEVSELQIHSEEKQQEKVPALPCKDAA